MGNVTSFLGPGISRFGVLMVSVFGCGGRVIPGLPVSCYMRWSRRRGLHRGVRWFFDSLMCRLGLAVDMHTSVVSRPPALGHLAVDHVPPEETGHDPRNKCRAVLHASLREDPFRKAKPASCRQAPVTPPALDVVASSAGASVGGRDATGGGV